MTFAVIVVLALAGFRLCTEFQANQQRPASGDAP